MAKVDGFGGESVMPGAPRKWSPLRVPCASLSARLGWLRSIGEYTLAEEEDTAGPSSHLDCVAKVNGVPSSSYVCRRVRGRKVVELLTEAVADEGRLMFIAARASFGVQAALTRMI